MSRSKNHQFLKQHGAELIRLGFPIVPIKPGTKYPGFDGWEHTIADQPQLTRWLANGFKHGGVGVLTSRFPAIDIDCEDPDVVDWVVNYCTMMFGAAPIRIGNAPKCLLLYRTAEPFTKIASSKFESRLGAALRVEVMAHGQQVVLQAVHPVTEQPYRWVDEWRLGEFKPEQLAAITADDARQLIADFETYVTSDAVGATLVSKRKVGGGELANVAPEDQALWAASPPMTVDVERIHAALDVLEADDYDMWCQVGMGLWHQYAGSNDGFELWDDWSQKSGKYDGAIMDAKWRSFKPDPLRPPITLRSILKLANEVRRNRVGSADPVDDMLKRYVYVRAGNLVADLFSRDHVSVFKLLEFEKYHHNVRVELDAPTPRNKKNKKLVRATDLWMAHPERKSALGVGYDPQAERLFRDEEGAYLINTFRLPAYKETNFTDLLDPFFAHFEYLFLYDNERDWFIDWLAFNVQYPERRCKVTPLHVATLHGTGRGWVVELIQRLVGPWNVSKAKMHMLAADGGFNGYLNNSLVCAVEEVYERDTRFAINDALRDTLTENYLDVNVKFGGQKTQRIYTNFFFMSNHRDAMVLSPNDRRINVFTGPDELKPRDYYTALYQWLDNPDAVNQLYWYLRRRDLSGFDFMRAMDTPGRREMIEVNRSEAEHLFFELLENPPQPVMAFDHIRDALNAMAGDAMSLDLGEKQLLALLRRHAKYYGQQIRIGTARIRPWVLDSSRRYDVDEVKQMHSVLENGRVGDAI